MRTCQTSYTHESERWFLAALQCYGVKHSPPADAIETKVLFAVQLCWMLLLSVLRNKCLFPTRDNSWFWWVPCVIIHCRSHLGFCGVSLLQNHLRLCAAMCMHVYVYMYVHVYARVCVCVCTCVYGAVSVQNEVQWTLAKTDKCPERNSFSIYIGLSLRRSEGPESRCPS